jgi:DNA-binding NarL/FixJ family response regulator
MFHNNNDQKSPSNKNEDELIINSLTRREIEVIRLISQGLSNNEIAERLFISSRTVAGHRNNLLQKTGSKNSVSLAVFAIRNSLV